MGKNVIVKDYELTLIPDDDTAFAEISRNERYAYIGFILTDSKPNKNKQMVPKEEFTNLLETGIHAPLKMQRETVAGKHGGAEPLGVITHLKEEEDGESIRGIAALWEKERPEDVKLIRQAYAENKPLNVSWEISYKTSEFTDEGVEILRGTSLNAATIVGIPAYSGRTPIYAVAELEEDGTLEKELEQLKERIATLEKENGELKQYKTNAETKLAEAETKIAELDEFKQAVETERAEAEKFESIKAKFAEASVEKDNEYFEKNREMLLALPENALEFLIQEAVAFSQRQANAEETNGGSGAPNITNNGGSLSSADVGRLLREQFSKEK